MTGCSVTKEVANAVAVICRQSRALCRISGLANTQNSHIWNANCPEAENNWEVISEERKGKSKVSIKLLPSPARPHGHRVGQAIREVGPLVEVFLIVLEGLIKTSLGGMGAFYSLQIALHLIINEMCCYLLEVLALTSVLGLFLPILGLIFIL